jgi:hypothetical protein
MFSLPTLLSEMVTQVRWGDPLGVTDLVGVVVALAAMVCVRFAFVLLVGSEVVGGALGGYPRWNYYKSMFGQAMCICLVLSVWRDHGFAMEWLECGWIPEAGTICAADAWREKMTFWVLSAMWIVDLPPNVHHALGSNGHCPSHLWLGAHSCRAAAPWWRSPMLNATTQKYVLNMSHIYPT